MTLPAARTVASFWRRLRRLFRRRPRLITRCARCGSALDNGQWLPSLPAEREVCGGTYLFDPMNGKAPFPVCTRLTRRLG